jgi:hypothetical protein
VISKQMWGQCVIKAGVGSVLQITGAGGGCVRLKQGWGSVRLKPKWGQYEIEAELGGGAGGD